MKTTKNRGVRRWKISSQLVLVYFVAIFLPVVLVGSYLISTVSRTQQNYYSDLLEAYNDGVKQTLYEITTQISTISESIVYNDELIEFLNGEYETEQELREAAANTTLLDKYAAKYAGVEQIYVYIDREDMINFGQFYKVTDEIRESDWYRKAGEQYIPFWMAYQSQGSRGTNLNWNLVLVRKMILVGGDREAVIMIKVRDSYLSSRLTNSRYTTTISVDDQQVAFASSMSLYGAKPDIELTYGVQNYSYLGNTLFNGHDSLVCVDTLKLTKSSNLMYLVSYDTDAMDNINRIVRTSWFVLALALILPLIIMFVFSRRFTGQVRSLRDEMGKASRGEYREMADELVGSAELADAFDDLQKMVRDIQRMEAEQYEAQIRHQSIVSDQQRMEFKILSSQINPHFLYNTLETIRMKALAAGDSEVATATKLLGKSMRYVLENTGNKDTTLQKELDHVLIYLQIQKLRFTDRVNYELDVEEGFDTAACRIPPLILQPIVENAIVHGLEGREADGLVKIRAARESFNGRSCVTVEIADNGIGMSEEELARLLEGLNLDDRELPTSSIGLYNINRRIRLIYGDEYALQFESTAGVGTKVALHLPV